MENISSCIRLVHDRSTGTEYVVVIRRRIISLAGVATSIIFLLKYACRDKTFRQNYVCRDKIFLSCLSRQAYFCRHKRRVLLRQTRVCRDKSKLCRDKDTFVATKDVFVWINVLSRQK